MPLFLMHLEFFSKEKQMADEKNHESKINLNSSLTPQEAKSGGVFINSRLKDQKEKSLKNEFTKKIDYKIEPGQDITKIDGPIFIKYNDKIEDDGSVRYFFADLGKQQYFHLFIWKSSENVERFDLHYDIIKHERVLSWNKKNKIFTNVLIAPESTKVLGIKKLQTFEDSMDFEWKEIKAKLRKRIIATIINKSKYNKNIFHETIELLSFIFYIIDDYFDK